MSVCWEISCNGGKIKVSGLNLDSENILVYEQWWQGTVLFTIITYRENSSPLPPHGTHFIQYPTSAVFLSLLAWPTALSFSWWTDESLTVNHSPLSFFFLPKMSRKTSVEVSSIFDISEQSFRCADFYLVFWTQLFVGVPHTYSFTKSPLTFPAFRV